jgi:hypothetical protein
MDMNTQVTQLVDYLGEYLIEPTEEEGILITTLDKSKCLKFVKSLTLIVIIFLKSRIKIVCF